MLSRSRRNHLAAALLAGCAVSFPLLLATNAELASTRPRRPDVVHGLVYVLSNHGSYNYISASDATSMALLFIMFAVCFVAGAVAMPKTAVFPRPTWASYFGRSWKTDLAEPAPEYMRTFGMAAAVYAVAIWYLGTSIVSTFVEHGIVLHM